MSGTSYHQVKQTHQHCHHSLVKQTRDETKSLEYLETETEIVAHMLTKHRKECFAQQYMLGKGLKVFPDDGPTACKVELKQMHERKCFKAIAIAELTRRERVRAQEGLMLLTKKRSGVIKGRLAYNGKKTRDWISKENTSSPTVGTHSIMLTFAIDDYER